MSRWKKELPTEILELVLARIPAHVLCRFRVVCKRWNHLITQHGFASLRAQVPRRASSVVITSKARYINPMWADEVGQNSEDSCEILDMSEKRFYALSDSFLLDYLDQRFQWIKRTLASDGELVYVMCSTPGDRAHIICNPMTKKLHHVIPEPNILFTDMVVMSADNATGSYRIVAIQGGISSSGRGRVYLYDSDSKTLGWRKICEVPGLGFSKSLQTGSCILLKGMLYTLLMNISMAPWRPQLNSCDLETGEWTYIEVELPRPSHPQERSQLVVSLGRLFFVEYTGLPIQGGSLWELHLRQMATKRKHLITVTIWEILLAEKRVKKVAEMPNFSKYPRKMVDESTYVKLAMGNPVVAVGCGDSLVISSVLGRHLEWDLVRNCWHQLPGNPDHLSGIGRQGIFAGIIDF